MATTALNEFRPVQVVACKVRLADLKRRQGKWNEAKTFLDELKDIAESINTLPMRAAAICAEGCLNRARNQYELAKQNLEDAVDIYDKISSLLDSSRTRMLVAQALVKLNEPELAEAELNNSMIISKKLGAEKDFEKAKYLQKTLFQDKADEIDRNKDKFTGRELDILKLIAEGKNNGEIAEKLFLSVRTVEKHITNIYSKLGISGKSARAYAASYTVKNKLLRTHD